MSVITLERMREVQGQLRGVIHPTPLQSSRTFSEMTGVQVYLKPECLQKAGSFKLRGAYSLVSGLPPEERARGLVTYSAGNWAQGVALTASIMGIGATVVMPSSPNPAKVAAARGYGATVVLYGTNSLELCDRAQQLRQEHSYAFIDPLGSPDLVAGDASIGLEIVDELPDVDAIVVPVGGGSMLAGIALAAKALNPRIRLFGVQPEGSRAMKLSLEAGHVVESDSVTVAEGLGVKRPGQYSFDVIKENVDDVVLVSDDEIVRAMLLLLERAKLVVEPSGAASLAALLSGKLNLGGKKVCVVLSGGNIDLPRLAKFLSAACM
ncbi:MAG: pyridoxal-phosphate dependent enzyme [Chloroflexi bacterium]|nr:pyridoxal-phosphate dependent enzyme [Chloroflexota bacterium]